MALRSGGFNFEVPPESFIAEEDIVPDIEEVECEPMIVSVELSNKEKLEVCPRASATTKMDVGVEGRSMGDRSLSPMVAPMIVDTDSTVKQGHANDNRLSRSLMPDRSVDRSNAAAVPLVTQIQSRQSAESAIPVSQPLSVTVNGAKGQMADGGVVPRVCIEGPAEVIHATQRVQPAVKEEEKKEGNGDSEVGGAIVDGGAEVQKSDQQMNSVPVANEHLDNQSTQPAPPEANLEESQTTPPPLEEKALTPEAKVESQAKQPLEAKMDTPPPEAEMESQATPPPEAKVDMPLPEAPKDDKAPKSSPVDSNEERLPMPTGVKVQDVEERPQAKMEESEARSEPPEAKAEQQPPLTPPAEADCQLPPTPPEPDDQQTPLPEANVKKDQAEAKMEVDPPAPSEMQVEEAQVIPLGAKIGVEQLEAKIEMTPVETKAEDQPTPSEPVEVQPTSLETSNAEETTSSEVKMEEESQPTPLEAKEEGLGGQSALSPTPEAITTTPNNVAAQSDATSKQVEEKSIPPPPPERPTTVVVAKPAEFRSPKCSPPPSSLSTGGGHLLEDYIPNAALLLQSPAPSLDDTSSLRVEPPSPRSETSTIDMPSFAETTPMDGQATPLELTGTLEADMVPSEYDMESSKDAQSEKFGSEISSEVSSLAPPTEDGGNEEGLPHEEQKITCGVDISFEAKEMPEPPPPPQPPLQQGEEVVAQEAIPTDDIAKKTPSEAKEDEEAMETDECVPAQTCSSQQDTNSHQDATSSSQQDNTHQDVPSLQDTQSLADQDSHGMTDDPPHTPTTTSKAATVAEVVAPLPTGNPQQGEEVSGSPALGLVDSGQVEVDLLVHAEAEDLSVFSSEAAEADQLRAAGALTTSTGRKGSSKLISKPNTSGLLKGGGGGARRGSQSSHGDSPGSARTPPPSSSAIKEGKRPRQEKQEVSSTVYETCLIHVCFRS